MKEEIVEEVVEEKIEDETPVQSIKIDVSGNSKIINESPEEGEKLDQSENPVILRIENQTSDIDLSEVLSGIDDIHYTNAEILSTLQDIADRPSVTPTIAYSLFFIAIVAYAFLSKK